MHRTWRWCVCVCVCVCTYRDAVGDAVPLPRHPRQRNEVMRCDTKGRDELPQLTREGNEQQLEGAPPIGALVHWVSETGRRSACRRCRSFRRICARDCGDAHGRVGIRAGQEPLPFGRVVLADMLGGVSAWVVGGHGDGMFVAHCGVAALGVAWPLGVRLCGRARGAQVMRQFE